MIVFGLERQSIIKNFPIFWVILTFYRVRHFFTDPMYLLINYLKISTSLNINNLFMCHALKMFLKPVSIQVLKTSLPCLPFGPLFFSKVANFHFRLEVRTSYRLLLNNSPQWFDKKFMDAWSLSFENSSRTRLKQHFVKLLLSVIWQGKVI